MSCSWSVWLKRLSFIDWTEALLQVQKTLYTTNFETKHVTLVMFNWYQLLNSLQTFLQSFCYKATALMQKLNDFNSVHSLYFHAELSAGPNWENDQNCHRLSPCDKYPTWNKINFENWSSCFCGYFLKNYCRLLSLLVSLALKKKKILL